jgi:LuxR family transcriptional regulator, maltose regulon positive regulatory protein
MTTIAGSAQGRLGRRRTVGTDFVLSFKVTVPPLPRWMVPRERIQTLIATGASGPLTVVTGPPGAGKTLALACWAAASRSRPIGWVTLDRFDNEPEIFWSYVIEALRRAGVALSPELPASATSQPDKFLHQLASVIAVQEPAVVLVLDDIQVLSEPASLDGLAYLLRNASTGLHLVVASRMDPLLPLHRYRLTGELTEIRAEDLAFNVPEAGLLIEQHGINLASESLKILTERYEGWAAGLRLAAISIAEHPDPEQFVKELDAEDTAIAGYLVGEVLDIQPAEVRDLLLKTSILDRVSVDLAGELAGNDEAAEVLPALAQANAFVQPIGHGWYRYHTLFADVLRLKLWHESPHTVRSLHRRAARWLLRNGTLAEAVSQAAAAGDWQLAARMTVDHFAVGPLLHPQACGPLADAFKHLPADCESGEPPLLIVASAMALRGGHGDSSVAALRSAERLLKRLPMDEEVSSRVASALIRLDLARRTGDVHLGAVAAAQAESLLGRMPTELLTRHPEVRTQVLSGRADVEMAAGRLDDAARTLDQGATVASSPSEWAECVGRRAIVEAVRGRFSRAAKLAETTLSASADSRPGIAWCPSPAAEVALAWVHLERNQLRGAADGLSRAQDALRNRPDRLIAAVAWLVAARLNLARGRPDTATEMVSRARYSWSAPPWLEERLALADSHARATAGDLESALEAAERAGPPSSPAGAIALARVRLTARETTTAARLLATASTTPAGETPAHVRLEAKLLEAELGYASGNPDRGRRSLEHALKLAESERLLLPIAIQRSWIEPVLRSDTHLGEIFRRMLDPAGADSSRSQGQVRTGTHAAPVLVEQLSDRELEVLRHVSSLLSTAEVAEQMYLSVNTVKSHLKSIFRKLGATHRGEAVRRARQLGLL